MKIRFGYGRFFYWSIMRRRCDRCDSHTPLTLHGFMGGCWVCPKCDFV